MHLVNGTGNSPSPGQPTPEVVKQDKSSGGSVDTTKTRSGPQRVRVSSGERPIGAAKGKQLDAKALCPPPPPVLLPAAPLLLTPSATPRHCAEGRCHLRHLPLIPLPPTVVGVWPQLLLPLPPGGNDLVPKLRHVFLVPRPDALDGRVPPADR